MHQRRDVLDVAGDHIDVTLPNDDLQRIDEPSKDASTVVRAFGDRRIDPVAQTTAQIGEDELDAVVAAGKGFPLEEDDPRFVRRGR